MLIEFEKLQENLVPKPRGGEGEMYTRTFQDENNKIMQIRLTPGSHLGMHTHEVDSEAFYILSGTGKVLCDGVDEPLAPRSFHYCPKGHGHRLMNDGTEDLVLVAIIPNHGA